MGFEEREKQRKSGVVSKLVGGNESTNDNIQQVQLSGKKRAGRPKLNREKKQRYTFTLLPSSYDKAQVIASLEGKSLSEVIDNYLADYVRKKQSMLDK